jgi:hypothetical protein
MRNPLCTMSGSTITNVTMPPVEWGTSYAAVYGGNLSNNGTSVGVTESIEGLPIFGLSFWGPNCKLGEQKVPLGGAANQQYSDLRNNLHDGNYLTSTKCSLFFKANPARSTEKAGVGGSTPPWPPNH